MCARSSSPIAGNPLSQSSPACREWYQRPPSSTRTAERTAAYLQLAESSHLMAKSPRRILLEHPLASSAPPRIAPTCAIHPGYGFLAENDHFAESPVVQESEFICPHSSRHGRRRGQVACKRPRLAKTGEGVPPSQLPKSRSKTRNRPTRRANRLPGPSIKAAAGGVGRGMRRGAQRRLAPRPVSKQAPEAETAFQGSNCLLENNFESAARRGGNHHRQSLQRLPPLSADCSCRDVTRQLVEESPSPPFETDPRGAVKPSSLIKPANTTPKPRVLPRDNPRTSTAARSTPSFRSITLSPIRSPGIDLSKTDFASPQAFPLSFRQKDVKADRPRDRSASTRRPAALHPLARPDPERRGALGLGVAGIRTVYAPIASRPNYDS